MFDLLLAIIVVGLIAVLAILAYDYGRRVGYDEAVETHNLVQRLRQYAESDKAAPERPATRDRSPYSR